MSIPATLPEHVQQIKEMDISYRTLHPCIIIKNSSDNRNIQIPFSSLTNKYRDFLSTIIISEKLDEETQELYAFKPKLVSMYLYGTTELWSDILILNEAVSIIDFKPKILRVYDPSKFKTYINEIIMLESENQY